MKKILDDNNPIYDNYYYCATFFGLCDLKKDKFCKFGVHIRGFNKITFKNEKYNIPSNSDEFLTDHYGNWRVPTNI